MNWRRRKKLWMGKRKLHVSDFVSQCLKCFSVRLVHFYVRLSQAAHCLSRDKLWATKPQVDCLLPKKTQDKSEQTPSPRLDQTCIIIPAEVEKNRCGEEEALSGLVQLRLILRSYQPTPAPDPKPRCPKQAWQWDNRAAERNTVFLPLQPLRSNRQNFHARTPRPQTSLSNGGLVDV